MADLLAPSSKMTGEAYIFLIVSIVIGVGAAGTIGWPLWAGIAMLALLGFTYFAGL